MLCDGTVSHEMYTVVFVGSVRCVYGTRTETAQRQNRDRTETEQIQNRYRTETEQRLNRVRIYKEQRLRRNTNEAVWRHNRDRIEIE